MLAVRFLICDILLYMSKVKVTPAFTKNYKMLNARQKEAVDSIDGPVMVVAGPGTGKTQILTLRIANILRQTDTPADGILALTFTESAAANMKERLVKMIGPEGYKVNVHTFHGFANSVIQNDPESFERLVLSKPMTDVEKILLLARIIDEGDYSELKPFYDKHMHLTSIMGAISELKRDAISAQTLKEFTVKELDRLRADETSYNKRTGKLKKEASAIEKKLLRGLELVDIYEKYEDLLRVEKLYDFEDMILELVRQMREDEDFKMRVQENFLYVLADEHQDANDAQNMLLELLTDFHESPNLFIVGDEKQAIYRFQGASLENFMYFKNKFKDAKVIELEDSYRSGQEILDAAHALMSHATDHLKRAKLHSKAGIEKAELSLAVYSDDEMEAAHVAKQVRRLLDEGVPAKEIALIYRTNADAELFVKALEKESVPFHIASGADTLKDKDINKFLLLLEAVNNFGHDEYLARVMHLDFLELDELDVYKTLKHYRRSKKSLYDIILSDKELQSAGVKDVKSMRSFGNFMARFGKLAKNEPLPEFINEILNNSGFLTFALNRKNSLDLLDKLHVLFKDASAMSAGQLDYKLEDFLEHLSILRKHKLSISKEPTLRPNTVKLMTAHKAKGLEFEHVFLLRVYDKKWGNRASRDKFILPTKKAKFDEGNDDERRLFFVALTRAKLAVHMSYGKFSEAGKERLPSVFVTELTGSALCNLDMSEEEARISKAELLKSAPLSAKSVADMEYLRALFMEQGLSVTALNNFLDCPWNFFYSNLIRIPKMQDKYLLLGNVLHHALFVLHEGLKHGQIKTKKELTVIMRDYLQKRAVGEQRAEDILKLAKEYLFAWMDHYKESFAKPQKTLNEYPIDVLFETGLEFLPQLRITGKLDKLEFVDDSEVLVYDYKTGKPRTRNKLLGKNKDGNKDYFRQLVFYKLLLDTEGKYKMRQGVIDFIQPKESGDFSREFFDISDDDMKELHSEMQAAVQSIYNFDFWDSRCEKHKQGKCEYCALRDMMR